MEETSNGIAKLSSVLDTRSKDLGDRNVLVDLGTIGMDYSLKPNSFPVAIPQGDYMICRSAAYSGGVFGSTSEELEEEYAHSHSVSYPSAMRRVQPGDTVLIVWAGNDVVVVDLVYPADRR